MRRCRHGPTVTATEVLLVQGTVNNHGDLDLEKNELFTKNESHENIRVLVMPIRKYKIEIRKLENFPKS